MHKRILITPILTISLILGISIMGFLFYAPNIIADTYPYEYLSFLGTFIGGILSPVVSLFGFVYIYLSFIKENNQSKVTNLLVVIEKNERELKELLSKKVFSVLGANEKVFEDTFESAIKIQKSEIRDDIFYYTEKCDQRSKMISEGYKLCRILFYIAFYSEKLKIDKDYAEISEFYRITYKSICKSILNSDLIISSNLFNHAFDEENKAQLKKYQIAISEYYLI
jgi:hypothetical protein